MATLTRMCVLLGSAFGVEIDDDKHVGELIEAIKGKKKNAFKSADADKLHLFLAKRKEGEWLNGPGAAAVATDDLVQFTPMDSTLKIGNDKYFGSNFHPGEGQVHVLVRVLVAVSEHLRVHRNMARDENLPVAKRVKIAQVEVAYQGLVPNDFYSVPVETIATYQKLEMAFLSRSSFGRICLLYGPRQFGKKTIAHRLLALLAADPSILVIYCSLTPSIVETEEKFWLAFSSIVGETTKSLFAFETMFSRRKTRLWLAIDDMNTMLTNAKLSINFLDCLRRWQSSKYFLGFLGIGSHDLLKIPIEVKTCIPFNLAEVFQAKLFSADQMSDFKQIEGSYPFRDSTRQGIMEYSFSSPGVFGSLVRFSIDFDKCNQERREWEHWFKIQNIDMSSSRIK